METTINTEVKHQDLSLEKKYFSNKTKGYAIGYLAALRHVAKVNHVPTEEKIDRLSKAAYACGLLGDGKKKADNPLAEATK